MRLFAFDLCLLACMLLIVQVGDGTTSVVLLAGEFLRQAKPFIEDGVHPQIIMRAYRKATTLALKSIKEVRKNNNNSKNICVWGKKRKSAKSIHNKHNAKV